MSHGRYVCELTLVLGGVAALALAGVFGLPAAIGSHPAGIQAQADSGVLLFNLSESQEATLGVDFYDPIRQPLPISIVPPVVGALRSSQVYLPMQIELRNGTYSAIVSSDQPITTLTHTEWLASGGLAAHGESKPGLGVVVPLVAKNSGGMSSVISVQNADPSAPAKAKLVVRSIGESEATHEVGFELPPGTAGTFDFAKSLFTQSLVDGFVGSARVESETASAVLSFLDVLGDTPGVSGFAGQPEEQAAARLAVPFVHARFPTPGLGEGSLTRSSSVALANVGSSAVQVVAELSGIAGACEGEKYRADIAIEPFSSAILDFTPDAASDSNVLPANCRAAATFVAEDGRIVGTLFDYARDETGAAVFAGAVNLVAESEAGLQTLVPLFRKDHRGITTGIHAMNVGDVQSEAHLQLFDGRGERIEGCDEACRATIGPGGSIAWWMGDLEVVPDRSYGHVVITSTVPLAVIASDEPSNEEFDLTLFAGVRVPDEDDPPTSQSARAHIPVLANRGILRAPPEVWLPFHVSASQGDIVEVPIRISSGARELVGAEIGFLLDPNCVSFDESDGNGDGIPDTVRFAVHDGYEAEARFEEDQERSELRLSVRRAGSSGPLLPDGELLAFDVAAEGACHDVPAIRPADRPQFTTASGDTIGGQMTEGLRVELSGVWYAYLPRLWRPD